MRLWFLRLTLFALAALPANALTKKVLIIGIDGTMPSALAVAQTPNLNALIANGCFSNRVVSHPVTHSAASWSSLFTGVWGDKHGVNDPGNSFAGNQFAIYPSFFKHLEDANPALNTVCLARWSPLLTVVPDADVKLSFSTDAAITTETVNRLTTTNPDVFYMILLDVDSAGHTYGWGPTVPQYVNAIEVADGRVGQIINALHSRATYAQEDWLVFVATDHGEHDNPDPERSRIVFSIVSGPSAARGIMWPSPSIVDVCATVLTHMGVPIDPLWKLDARVEGFPLPPVPYGANLIYNGDAEANSGANNYTPNRGIAWWFDLNSVTLGIYGSNAAFPSAASPGPAKRGNNFFLGGTASASISQRINLADIALDIDSPGVNYTLSGWFGGAGSDADSAMLTVSFLDAQGAVLGTDSAGAVTAAERGNVTGLLQRSESGVLPVGTRFVEFVLTCSSATGSNDASADNLSFVLVPNPDPGFKILGYGPVTSGWQIEVSSLSYRSYSLERSDDLQTWQEVVAPIPGTGGPLMLTDPDPPATRAFYRVAYRRL
jgi:hypothetical protein